jgi:hypothetical protein
MAARSTLTVAQALADECEDVLLGAEILRELGQICEARGERDEASEVWTKAHSGFLNVGAESDASAVAARLQLLR